MSSDFHQTLWNGWLENKLNWGQFDFDKLLTLSKVPNSGVRHRRCLWLKYTDDISWELQDSNLFYYPLFGLGPEKNPDVAIVCAGPAYNDNNEWQQFTNSSSRETIHGPPQRSSDWLTGSNINEKYEQDFYEQRKEWQKVRDPNFENSKACEANTMVKKIRKILDGIDSIEFDKSSDSVFDKAYITNFMKDGELKDADVSWSDWSDLWINDDGISGKNTLSFADVDNPLVWDENMWPGPNNSGANSERRFRVELARIISREFWLPILGVELAEVRPSIILSVGRPTTHAVYQLYDVNLEGHKNITQVEHPEDLVINRENNDGFNNPVVVPTPHWANGNWSKGAWSPKKVAEMVDNYI